MKKIRRILAWVLACGMLINTVLPVMAEDTAGAAAVQNNLEEGRQDADIVQPTEETPQPEEQDQPAEPDQPVVTDGQQITEGQQPETGQPESPQEPKDEIEPEEKLVNYTAYIVWEDEDNEAQRRPDKETWEASIQFYRYIKGAQIESAEKYEPREIQLTETDSQWTLAAEKLPAESGEGAEYCYFIREKEESTLSDAYEISCENTGEYLEAEEELYTEGTWTYTFKVEETDGEQQETIKSVPSLFAVQQDIRAAAGPQILMVKWNDNKNENGSGRRPEPADYAKGIQIEFQVEGDPSWHTLTTSTMGVIGLTEMPVIESKDVNSSFNTWIYECSTLPAQTESKSISYRYRHGEIEGYLSEEPVDKTAGSTGLTYTGIGEFKAYKQWLDNNNSYNTRPEAEAWKDTIVVQRYVLGDSLDYNSDKIIDSSQYSVTSGKGDRWMIQTEKLPGYDAEGMPYVYYVREKTVQTESNYTAQYVNIGNFASRTTELYNGGTITNTLIGTTEFMLTKLWIDGSQTPESRPEADWYLYRFADDGISDFASASPVQHFDNMQVPASGTEDNDVWSGIYTADGSTTILPKYDANGCKYIYFVKERFREDAGDYIFTVDNTEAVDQEYANQAGDQYLLNGGTAINERTAEIYISATKTFAAQAMQGINQENTSVTFRLQRRSKGAAVWETVTGSDGKDMKLTIEGFSAETMHKTENFPEAVPKYNDDGQEYEYRYIEVGMKVEGSAPQNPDIQLQPDTDGSTDNQIVRLGEVAQDETTAKFRVTREADGSIKNTLVGITEVYVKKTWTETDADGNPIENVEPGADKVEIQLLRNGQSGAVDNAGYPVEPMILSRENNWEDTFVNLPRYDEDGREYEYSLKEVSVAGYYTKIRYHKTTRALENGEIITRLETVVNNHKGPGILLVFDVEKVWLDDGDLMHRYPVEVGIYRKGSKGSKEPVATATLNSNNIWQERIEIAPVEASDTVEDYVVREIKLGNNYTAEYEWDVKDIKGNDSRLLSAYDAIAKGTASIAGEVDTDQHLYNIYINHHTVVDENNQDAKKDHAAYTITNQRKGIQEYKLTKTWKAGGDAPESAFEMTRSVGSQSDGVIAKFTLKDESGSAETVKTATWTSENEYKDGLPKYDNLGRLYTYTITETAIGGVKVESGQAVVPDKDTGLDETYLASAAIDKIHYGKQHTDDVFEWSAVNQKTGTHSLTVNKVWRDDGTARNLIARPDVVFNLYSTTEKTPDELTAMSDTEMEAFAGTAKMEAADCLWNTKHNDWFWTCELGEFPKYDENGNAIVYFLIETIRSNAGNYEAEYYNGLEQPKEEAIENDTTKEVFDPADYKDKTNKSVMIVADGTSAYPGELPSTTVNIRRDIRELDGEKIWLNLPPAFEQKNLPVLTLTLYRSLSDTEADIFKDENTVKKDGSPLTVELKDGKTTYSFGTQQKYDEYGRMYYYGVKEDSVAGYNDQTVQTAANDFIIKNVYFENQSNNRVEIRVTKSWEIPAGYEGKTLADVEFVLYRQLADADGKAVAGTEEEVVSQTLTPDNSSEVTLTFKTTDNSDSQEKYLPYYAPNGNPYQYFVKEKVPNGYTAEAGANTVLDTEEADRILTGPVIELESKTVEGNTVWENNAASANAFHNTYTENPTVEITAQKTWDDAGNKYETRPDEIKFTLFRSTQKLWEEQVGQAVTVSVDSKGVWKYDFGQQIKYATTGEAYKYYVKEEAVAGYTTNGSGTAVNITNNLPMKTLTVKKNWDKQQGTDGTASPMTDQEIEWLAALGAFPDSITFTVEYSENNGTDWVTLQEKVGTELRDVEKIVDLSTNKTQQIKQLRDNGITFQNIPQYAKGGTDVTRIYRVRESVPQGYTNIKSDADQVKEVNGVITVTNTLPVREVQIDKVWVDNSNRDDTRPDSLKVSITRDGQEEQKQSFTLDRNHAVSGGADGSNWDTWSTAIFYVPLYKNSNTEYSVYSAEEGIVTGKNNAVYTGANTSSYPKHTDSDPLISETDNYNYFSFTNTLKNVDTNRASVEIKAEKKWDGDATYSTLARPEEVSYTLYVKTGDVFEVATAENCGLPVGMEATQKAGADGKYTASWKGVWKYTQSQDAIAKPMEYQVKEAANEPYTPSYDKESVKGTDDNLTFTVTNTMKETTAHFSKNWLSETSGGDLTLSDTALQNMLDANVILKKVKFGVYYSTTPETESSWKALTGADNQPVISEQDTDTVDRIKSLRDMGVTISGLPEYDKSGAKLFYQVREISALFDGDFTEAEAGKLGGFKADYRADTSKTPNDTVNTNTLPTGSVTVNKDWQDEENRDDTRTDITVQLYRDGVKYGASVQIQKDTDGGWSYTWTELPIYQNGKSFKAENRSVYTVTETNVEGYEEPIYAPENITADAGANKAIIITNTHESAFFHIAASKVWADDDNYGLRPASVTLKLQAATSIDGENYSEYADVVTDSYKGRASGAYTSSEISQQLTADNNGNWGTARWENLPVYSEGQPIRYRVVEEQIPGYTTIYSTEEIEGEEASALEDKTTNITVTNTLSDKTSVTVNKVWDEMASIYQMIPDYVEVQLQCEKADGWKDVENGAHRLSAKDTWAYTYSNLPTVNEQGAVYKYRVVETALMYGKTKITVIPKGQDAMEGTAGAYKTAGSISGSTEEGYKVELVNTLEITSLEVEKVWDDQENCYGTRPETDLTVKVQQRLDENDEWKDVQKAGKEVTGLLKYNAETQTWDKTEFAGLPAADKTGKLYEYRAVEVTEVPGYESESENPENGYTRITNTLKTVDISVTKTWKDFDNKYLTRPMAIELTLSTQAGELEFQPDINCLTQGSIWEYQIAGLPKYLAGTEEEAVYSLKETQVEGYEAEAEVLEVEDGRADFVNELVMPGCSVTITKHGGNLNGPKLAGCTYILCREKDEGSGIEYFKGYENGRAIFSDARAEAMEIMIGADGTATVNGLPYGNYYFLEIKAPQGYAIDETPIRFHIDAKNQGELPIVAQADPKLPETTSSITTKTTKTGDQKPLQMLWITLIMAFMTMAGITATRRKQKKG